MERSPFPDFVPAPNIGRHPGVYERENEALANDGRLDRALAALAPWTGRTLLDVGCGTGFWLPHYARSAIRVIGVEPDPVLVAEAARRVEREQSVTVEAGSAEHLPVADDSVDVVHARFAYFFGPGAELGLAEAARVLRPGGALVVVDNEWSGGDFAKLLRRATTGNAAIDPDATVRWWSERGAVRHIVEGGWQARTTAELDEILRIEFPADVIDEFMADHHSSSLSYRFAVYLWRP